MTNRPQAIPKTIHCPCGFVVRATEEAALVQQAQQHAKETHGMELSREQAMAMAHPE